MQPPPLRRRRFFTSAWLLACALALSAAPGGCGCEEPPGDAGPDAGPPSQDLTAPAGAVGCELLLSEQDGAVTVRFGDATRGTAVREAPKVAVAAVTEGALALSVSGAFELLSSRCVNASGDDVGEIEVPQ
jgi:hypothetical protein